MDGFLWILQIQCSPVQSSPVARLTNSTEIEAGQILITRCANNTQQQQQQKMRFDDYWRYEVERSGIENKKDVENPRSGKSG